MAKLRDTAIKDNLAIAGNVTAAGKVLSVEGHTHIPANITGLDKYIEDKVKASGTTLPENINAKTLDGHTASDFVLKSESTTSSNSDKVFYFSKNILSAQKSLTIKLPDSIVSFDYTVIATTDNYKITLKSDSKTIEFFNPVINYNASWGKETESTLFINNIGREIYQPISIKVEIISNVEFDKKDISITDGAKQNQYYIFKINKKSIINLGYTLYQSKEAGSFLYSTRYNIPEPANGNTLTALGLVNFKIIDLDNNMVIRRYAGNVSVYNKTSNLIFYQESNKLLISGISKNLLIYLSDNTGIVYFTDFTSTFNNRTFTEDANDKAAPDYINIEKAKEIFDKSSISATINGVQFDGKTNITTPATKLITPVHINGIEFDGSQDITIPAPTNALTLGGLDSSQYIKATDVGNAAGKIPRFDNDGFLVYPDGSKERIENG